MALKGNLSSKRSKRTSNVLKYGALKSDEMNSSVSDSYSEVSTRKSKVRNGLSTKKILKNSEFYNTDNDHIYTSASPHATPTNNSGRKKNISQGSVEKPSKQKCFSKNAVMARLNRERKKKYISSLESKNDALQKQVTEMKEKIENQNKNIYTMQREVLYLKGLLANSKELGWILRNLNETIGLPITSSMVPLTESKHKAVEGSTVTHPEYNSRGEHLSKAGSVNCGNNFPILHKDINLGNCSDKLCDSNAGLEFYPFDFESSAYDLNKPFLAHDDSNLNFLNSDVEFEESSNLQDFAEKDPNIGICLHVNQRKVSIEVCSICNSRAGCSLRD